MLDPAQVPDVDLQELLARYVFSRSHIRRQTGQVKADAFMPPPNLKLSVTRHREATEAEIWDVGHRAASASQRTLHGRADTAAAAFVGQKLEVVAAPDPAFGNPNHANVVGWPESDKPAQKLIALEIAAASTFRAPPDS